MTATTLSIHANSPDEVLVQAWINDQHELAFEYLVERYAPMLQQVCKRQWSGDAARADEAVQTVFIILSRKAEQIRNTKNIGPWLHRCAVNTVNMQLRLEARQSKRDLQKLPELPAATEDEANEEFELQPVMDKAVNSLSNKYRESVVMFYFQQYSIKEIATELDISESAVKRRLHESRNRIRTWFLRAGYSASLLSITAVLNTLQAQSQPTLNAQDIAGYFPPTKALVAPQTEILVHKVIRDMTIHKITLYSRAALLLIVCMLIGVSAAERLRSDQGNEQQEHNKDLVVEEWEQNLEILIDEGLIHPQKKDKVAKRVIMALFEKHSVSFEDTSLSDISMFLQQLTGVPFHVAEELSEEAPSITLKVTDMELKSVLNWILQVADLSLMIDENGIRFINVDDILDKEIELAKTQLNIANFVRAVEGQTKNTFKIDSNIDVESVIYDFQMKVMPLRIYLKHLVNQKKRLRFTVKNNMLIHLYERDPQESVGNTALSKETRKDVQTLGFAADLKSTNLRNLIGLIERQVNVKVIIDPELKPTNAVLNERFDIKQHKTTAHDLLKTYILPRLKAEYVVVDDAIYITSAQEAAEF